MMRSLQRAYMPHGATPAQRWIGITASLLAVVFALASLVVQIRSLPRSSGRLELRAESDIDLLAVPQFFAAAAGLPLRISWEDSVRSPGRLRTELNSLHWTTLVIENVGERGFDWAERALAPLVLSVETGEILQARRDPAQRRNPRPALEIALAGSRRSAELRFDYLNPGEAIRVIVAHTGGTKGLGVAGRFREHDSPKLVYEEATRAVNKRETVTTLIRSQASWLMVLVTPLFARYRMSQGQERPGRAWLFAWLACTCGAYWLLWALLVVGEAAGLLDQLTALSWMSPLHVMGAVAVAAWWTKRVAPVRAGWE
jgi:hypothetical protein